MSDIKTEPTSDQAKQVKLDQEREAGGKSPNPHINPRNGANISADSTTDKSNSTASEGSSSEERL